MSEDGSIEQAKNRAHALLASAEADLAAGRIDEAGWYARVAAVVTPAHLAGANPRAQSGHSGDEAHWRAARGLVAECLDRDGTFLDVGCANGHLMECVQRWARPREIEPHGLDVAPELAALARARLPRWADRIHTGNAIDWEPPRRYDFVRTGLEYVPERRQADLVARLLDRAVAPGGRLLIGVYNEEREGRRERPTTPTVEEQVTGWGFAVAGRVERPHHRDPRLFYRVLWLEA